MDGYRISLWSPEIFAVLSMVPCFLITYFSENSKHQLIVMFNDVLAASYC